MSEGNSYKRIYSDEQQSNINKSSYTRALFRGATESLPSFGPTSSFTGVDSLTMTAMLTEGKIHRPARHTEQKIHRLSEIRNQKPRFGAFIKCIVLSAVTVYPPIAFAQRLSNYHGHQFVTCNDEDCVYTKIFGTDHLKSTFRSWSEWRDFFVVVRNGHQSTNKYLQLSPVCPNKSEDAMKILCRSHDTMSKVENTLGRGVSKIVFEVCVFGWCLFKIIHDCCMMLEVCSEYATQIIGLASLAFQMCGVGAAFAWSMGAAAVFVAPLPEEGSCACYYQLPKVETLLAAANPLILFAFACTKLTNVHRAAVSGDFLYFTTYDVPYRVVKHSLRDPGGSLMVSTIHGKYVLPDIGTDQHLSLVQLRFMWALLHVCFDWLLLGTMVLAASIAIGPTSLKLLQLAVSFRVTHSAAALLMVPPFLSAYTNMRFFVSISTGTPKLKESVLQWSRTHSILQLGIVMFEVTLVTCSSYVLVQAVLDRDEFGRDRCPIESMKCAVAAMITLVFGLVRFVYDRIVMPPFYALATKAKAPYNPSEFLEWADDYPEFDLGEDVIMASDFIQQEEENNGGVMPRWHDWVRRWEKVLGLPIVPRFCHALNLRLKMILQGCTGTNEETSLDE